MKKNQNITVLLLAFFLATAWLCADSDMVKGDYSGWPANRIFAELARKSGINLVGDFPKTVIPSFRLQSETYYEEALNLLARCTKLVLRRDGEIWAAVKPGKREKEEDPVGVCKLPSWRPAAVLQGILQPLVPQGVQIKAHSGSSRLTIAGSRHLVEEIKKTFETIDTPSGNILYDFTIETGDPQHPVASCSFTALGRRPFHIASQFPGTSSSSFEVHGTGTLNDDGILSLTLLMTLRRDDRTDTFSQSLFGREKEWLETTLLRNGVPLKCSWRGTFIGFKGAVRADSGKEPAITGVPPEKAEKKEPDRSFQVVSESPAPALDEPFVLEDVSVPVILERLAVEEKSPLICDDSATGTISAYCYGERLDREELLETIARVKGLDVFKGGDGFVIGTPQAVKGLALEGQPPFLSPELKTISPASGARILTDTFRENQLEGAVEIVSGNRLQVRAEQAGLDLAKTLCDEWGEPLPAFSLGLELLTPGAGHVEQEKISRTRALEKVWEQGPAQVQALVAVLLADREAGLRQVAYRIQVLNPQGPMWKIEASTGLPDKEGDPFISAGEPFPFRSRWRGVLTPPPNEPSGISEPVQGTPPDAAFDSSF